MSSANQDLQDEYEKEAELLDDDFLLRQADETSEVNNSDNNDEDQEAAHVTKVSNELLY